jgi:hypothetical protein
MSIENIKKDVLSPDVLSLQMFFLLDVLSPDVLSLWMFCPKDIMSPEI